jgi:hypothetical protein
MRVAVVPGACRHPGIGVDDGTRTHDDRNHNPGLYQLSYAHHKYIAKPEVPALYRPGTVTGIWRARQDSNLQPSA